MLLQCAQGNCRNIEKKLLPCAHVNSRNPQQRILTCVVLHMAIDVSCAFAIDMCGFEIQIQTFEFEACVIAQR